MKLCYTMHSVLNLSILNLCEVISHVGTLCGLFEQTDGNEGFSPEIHSLQGIGPLRRMRGVETGGNRDEKTLCFAGRSGGTKRELAQALIKSRRRVFRRRGGRIIQSLPGKESVRVYLQSLEYTAGSNAESDRCRTGLRILRYSAACSADPGRLRCPNACSVDCA